MDSSEDKLFTIKKATIKRFKQLSSNKKLNIQLPNHREIIINSRSKAFGTARGTDILRVEPHVAYRVGPSSESCRLLEEQLSGALVIIVCERYPS